MSAINHPQKTLQIVLADDNSNECMLFENALTNLHIPFKFSQAQNGEALLKMIDEGEVTPDFIFLDFHSHGISSQDCLEALKSRKKLKSVPVILYSESMNPRDKDYCYNTTANEYFLKALFFLL